MRFSSLSLLLLSALACRSAPDLDGDGIDDLTDCDDQNPNVGPGNDEVCNGVDDDCDGQTDNDATDAVTWYADADEDGFGDNGSGVVACDAPLGATAAPSDCDDTDAAVHPGAPETDCADPTDYNCDGSVGYADADQDGAAACEDCDDQAAGVNPQAVESCNGIDDDCDGDTDEAGATGEVQGYTDADEDGFGDPEAPVSGCALPDGAVTNATDCDDAKPAVNPSATEVCNGADDDCDALVDDADDSRDLETATTWHADLDEDGFGDPDVTQRLCAQPEKYVIDASDCDDGDFDVNPAATEVCNGVDDDCAGGTDDEDDELDLTTASDWYADADGDQFGDAETVARTCEAPDGYLADHADCDDGKLAVNPAATEVCNGVDDDCDTQIDDADDSRDLATATTWHADLDDDGFGDPDATQRLCAQPAKHVIDASDCDDGDFDVNPAATEVCNGVDDDCAGGTDDQDADLDLTTASDWFADVDGDLFGDAETSVRTCVAPADFVADATDCDDGKLAVNPAAAEACNGVDDDCEGGVDEGVTTTFYADADGDTYGVSGTTTQACSLPVGYAARALDCDDGKLAVNPAATEVCNGFDDDCDTSTDDADASLDLATATRWYADVDGDTYGNPGSSQVRCVKPANHVTDKGDCLDTDGAIHPGATEVFYDDVDQDCSGTSDHDQDGDGLDADFMGGADCEDRDATLTDDCFGGTGKDGTPTLAAGNVTVNSYTTLNGDAIEGDWIVPVASTSAFSVGDELMIVQSRGVGAGAYEFARVVSIGTGELTLSRPLANDYSNIGSDKAQVVRVPNYTALTVASGTTLKARDWDGATGGVLAVRSANTITVAGTVSVANQGFRGVTSPNTLNHPGEQGEGDKGAWTKTRVSNGNGGGGGERNGCECCWGGAGAGGGHAETGSNGANGGNACQLGGVGGAVVGNTAQTLIYFGGAGGQGGADEDGYGSEGANGGGIAYLGALSLTVTGTLTADGENGALEVNASGCGSGGGGAGAGGAIYLDVGAAALGTNRVTTLGGIGGDNVSNCGTPGGDGGDGRITLRGGAGGVTGTTIPTYVKIP